MAVTWRLHGTRRLNFRASLQLSTRTQAMSPQPAYSPDVPPTRPTTITSRANCYTTQNTGLLRMCSVCSAVTFLGNDRVPSFINEVTCGQTSCSSSNKVIGTCQNSVMHQQFFNRTGRCDPRTGYEELLPYTQAIRVGCECMVFPI